MLLVGVVLDACVLIPASLRDTLLRAANADLYQLWLTDNILEEVSRNLIKQGMSQAHAQKLIGTIQEYFAECFVRQYDQLIPAMPINDKDKHVLASAVASSAQIIVTQNLKDFRAHQLNPFGVEAQSPDDFLVHLFYFDPERIIQILVEQANVLRKPRRTLLEVLDTLHCHVPSFVNLVKQVVHEDDLQR